MTWKIASASGSISAARGRKKVGDRVWMCGSFGGMGVLEEGTVGEEDEGRKCEVRDWRRVLAVDILSLELSFLLLRFEV